MRILYYDCFSGISGDMNLAAMIDLGVDSEYVLNELSKLDIHEYTIEITNGNRKGISGTRVDVKLKERAQGHEHEEHDHNHRNISDIKHLIMKSGLSDNVKKISLDIFMKVAEAEAKVHGKPVEEVHFHEVGAVDSIVDIVGAAICFDYLKVDKVIASPVETGSGFVKCAHGTLPVPAPATAEILKGIPIKSSGVPFEATTPTGAAILSKLVDEFTEAKDFKIIKIGYGIGHKDAGSIPNVLRIFIGEKKEKAERNLDIINEKAFIVECNIDDMNPENYDYIMEKLFSKGAMDAYLTTIIMKKGRPAVKISVLCSKDIMEGVERFLLSETSTLGVRRFQVEKEMLKREIIVIHTAYGNVRVKNAYFQGKVIKRKPEYDDCKKIAMEKGIPIMRVYEEINREIQSMEA